ncbi:MAG: hypothetical protein ACLGI9_09285, partial [Thermoanaerobaculia bacterium]
VNLLDSKGLDAGIRRIAPGLKPSAEKKSVEVVSESASAATKRVEACGEAVVLQQFLVEADPRLSSPKRR